MEPQKPILRCAINGYGRIGRSVLRALFEVGRWPIQIVAINDLAAGQTIAHLTRFDSTHGRFALPVRHVDNSLVIDDQRIKLLQQPQISHGLWSELGVTLVLECSGQVARRDQAQVHLDAGADRVLISNPADDQVDATIVYGVNHQVLTGKERVVSNASCTSNCIIPVIEALDQAVGIDCGTITTIHSAMNDQSVIDTACSDLRLCRAAGVSIIPVPTGLHKGIARILPRFAGRFETTALRVPTINVTAMSLNLVVAGETRAEAINAILDAAAGTRFSGVMAYCQQPLASIDFNHDPHSCIVDATQTRVSAGRLVQLLVWCDNEWGFANRMLDTATVMTSATLEIPS